MKFVALRLSLTFVAICGLLSACSDQEQSFCNQAFELVEFQGRFGEVVSSKNEMESFMSNWGTRLDDLADVAPDSAQAELSAMQTGVDRFDSELAGVSYDIFQLPLDGLSDPDFDEARARFDLILRDDCNIVPDGAELLVEAPDPLDDDEFDELVDTDIEQGTVEDQMWVEFETQLGLSTEQMSCFQAAVSTEQLEQFVGGNPDTETAGVIVAAVDSCGIDLS